jgi:hypothetical protein
MKTFLSIIEDAPQIVKDKLEQLKGLRERPDYHPEPSTFHHIEIVTNRLIQTGDNDLIFAGILHDICKLDCKTINPKTGQPTSPGHDKAALDLIHSNREIRQWITDNDADWRNVAGIVFGHMRFHQLEKMRPFKRDKQIQDWKDQGIYEKLRFHGAADNMLVEFDMNDLEKSFKHREDKDFDESHALDQVMNNDIKTI